MYLFTICISNKIQYPEFFLTHASTNNQCSPQHYRSTVALISSSAFIELFDCFEVTEIFSLQNVLKYAFHNYLEVTTSNHSCENRFLDPCYII